MPSVAYARRRRGSMVGISAVNLLTVRVVDVRALLAWFSRSADTGSPRSPDHTASRTHGRRDPRTFAGSSLGVRKPGRDNSSTALANRVPQAHDSRRFPTVEGGPPGGFNDRPARCNLSTMIAETRCPQRRAAPSHPPGRCCSQPCARDSPAVVPAVRPGTGSAIVNRCARSANGVAHLQC